MKLAFKNERIFRNFSLVEIHPNLIAILLWLFKKFYEIIITSAYRAIKIHSKDSGIHSVKPLRAVDLRSWIFASPDDVAERINKNWEYDPKRPKLKVCVLHDSGQGVHFHLQVHDNTIRRKS